MQNQFQKYYSHQYKHWTVFTFAGETITLGSFNLQEGTDLVRRRKGKAYEKRRASFRLCGLPLAHDQAVAYLKRLFHLQRIKKESLK